MFRKEHSAADPTLELLTRRRLLKGAAGIAVAAAAQSLMPMNVRRVLAQGPPQSGSINDIKHVVL
jgi:phospholipase C